MTAVYRPHEQHVIAEKAELDVKIERLSDFISGEEFENLEAKDQGLLKSQALVMREYSAILGARIEGFKSMSDSEDFPLGAPSDLSGEVICEACQ